MTAPKNNKRTITHPEGRGRSKLYRRHKGDTVEKISSEVSLPEESCLVSPPAEPIDSQKWTEEDDSMLRDAVLRHGEDWCVVREFILRPEAKGTKSPRTADECERRWNEVVAHKHKKGPWTEDEDRLVCKLVKAQGPKKWSVLSAYVPGRTGKQCRERWVNHLSPDVNKGEWTEEEEQTLLDQHSKLGNQWCKIAQFLPGRSENAVKNRWNSFANRCSALHKADGVVSMRQKPRNRKSSKNRATLREKSVLDTALETFDALTSPKKVMRRPVAPLTQSPKPSSSMINIRRRLAKPLFINPRIDFLGDDDFDANACVMTDFDSVLLSPEHSPDAMCLSPALLSPMSPQCSLNSFRFSPLASLWPKSPVHPHDSAERC